MDQLNMLAAHDLYRFYHVADDEIFALRGVSLAIDAGEFVAVTGPSGSGKSTLLSCLAGLDEPDGGWVMIGNERITRRPEGHRSRLRAQHIGMLMQSGNLFDHLTVKGNLDLVGSIVGRVGRSRTMDLLRSVGIAHRANGVPAQLSGGELARAGIALATIHNPSILLADEPTAEIDRENEHSILELFRQRSREGWSTLVATHSAYVVAAADRVLHLVDGRLSDA